METSTLVNDRLPRSWQAPDIPGLELLDGTFRDHVFPRHSHDGLMLSVIDAGAQRLVHGGTSHIAGSGDIVAIPPGEVHSGRAAADQGWRYRVLTIPESLLLSAGRERAKGGFRSPVVIDDRDFRRQLSAVHLAFTGASNTLERECRLLDALQTFFRATPLPERRRCVSAAKRLPWRVQWNFSGLTMIEPSPWRSSPPAQISMPIGSRAPSRVSWVCHLMPIICSVGCAPLSIDWRRVIQFSMWRMQRASLINPISLGISNV